MTIFLLPSVTGQEAGRVGSDGGLAEKTEFTLGVNEGNTTS